jgi:hypothetical protein
MVFNYKPVSKQIVEQRNIAKATKAEAAKNTADLDYISMMTGIDLSSDETEQEVTNEE